MLESQQIKKKTIFNTTKIVLPHNACYFQHKNLKKKKTFNTQRYTMYIHFHLE